MNFIRMRLDNGDKKELISNSCHIKDFDSQWFLVFVLSNELQAEQESKSEKSYEQPYAYLFPAKLNKLTEQLQRENIEVCELREDIELDVAAYRIERIVRDKKQAQKQRTFRFRTECSTN